MSQVQVHYDNKSQYERVVAQLLEGEQLFAVYDLKGVGTGFIGLTDRRLIFYDQNFLDSKDVALVSLPYSRISYIAAKTEQKRFARDESVLTVAVGSHTFKYEFNGVDPAQRAYKLIARFICITK